MSRTIRVAAALAALTLVACSESPVAPATTEVMPEAALVRIKLPPTVLVSARTISTSGVPASMTIKFTSGQTTQTVVETHDNSEIDLDRRISYVQVRIVKSNVYQAQVTKGEALLYKGDAPKVLVANGNMVDFGNLVLKYNPFIEVRNFDGGSIIGGPVAGGKYEIVGLMTLTENDANDREPMSGRVKAVVQGTGTYTVCELTPPAGFAMLTPACFDVTTGSWGTTKVVSFTRTPLR